MSRGEEITAEPKDDGMVIIFGKLWENCDVELVAAVDSAVAESDDVGPNSNVK